jgi:tetratricopeptide (TPR) repeat protein
LFVVIVWFRFFKKTLIMQKTILFLAANPKKTSKLNLEKEVAEVEKELARLQRHKKFIFKQQWATTLDALRHALLDHQPYIIHFSGHGAGQAGIVLENEGGEALIVSGDTLADFFKLSPHIKCVILNACFSALQASEIVRHIHFVIGMNQPIKDRAAIQFSKGFYDALAVGESIPIAFEFGRTEMSQMSEEHLKPVLKQRFVGVDNFWLMPIRENHFFTGREDILHQLQDILPFRQAAALTGLGGMGKTQIAAHYAFSHQNEYRAVLWCLADRIESLNLGLVAIARTLGLPKAPEQRFTIAAVKDWLATHTHWLLILDNADELQIVGDLTALAKDEARHVLLTTRTIVPAPFAQSVAVHEMSRNEGIRFLLCRALDKARDKDGVVRDYKFTDKINAGKLVDILGALPLTLDQAGAYIRETQCGLAGYLDRYRTGGHALLRERGMLYCSQDHPESLAIIWRLSFEKIMAENPTAIGVLCLCAFLHPDSIPEEVFQYWDVSILDKALKVILKYSFVKRHPKTKILMIHRLVQTILRHEMDEAMQRSWAEETVRLMDSVFQLAEFKNCLICERLLSCAQSSAALIEEWKLESEEAGRLLNKMGYYLDNTKGDYEQAKPLYERSLAIREKVFGKEHPSVATSLNNLALLYQTQGYSGQAKPLYERSLAIYEKAFGKEHSSVATSLNNLAALYDSQGASEQAKLLYERSLAIREKVFGKEHPLVANSLNNLALLYDSQGAYEQANPLYERTLKIMNKFFQPDHPTVRAVLKNYVYASLLREMKKPTEASKE